MTAFVLDSSAVIAFLAEEPGHLAAAKYIEDSVMTTVNAAEVVSFFVRNGALRPDIEDMLGDLATRTVVFDEPMAVMSGLMIAETRSAGLSLADRACLSLARILGVPAVTGDRPWTKVAGVLGVEIILFR